jgi:hypothetical protein
MASPQTSFPPPVPTESVNSFVPRPFPPPSLVGVPLEYIVDSLRKLAPRYWNNAETADCSISEYSDSALTIVLISCLVYPVDDRPPGLSAQDSSVPRVPRTEMLSSSHDPSGMGRRLTAPSLNREPVRVLMKVRRLSAFVKETVFSHIICNSSILTISLRNRLS